MAGSVDRKVEINRGTVEPAWHGPFNLNASLPNESKDCAPEFFTLDDIRRPFLLRVFDSSDSHQSPEPSQVCYRVRSRK